MYYIGTYSDIRRVRDMMNIQNNLPSPGVGVSCEYCGFNKAHLDADDNLICNSCNQSLKIAGWCIQIVPIQDMGDGNWQIYGNYLMLDDLSAEDLAFINTLNTIV